VKSRDGRSVEKRENRGRFRKRREGGKKTGKVDKRNAKGENGGKEDREFDEPGSRREKRGKRMFDLRKRRTNPKRRPPPKRGESFRKEGKGRGGRGETLTWRFAGEGGLRCAIDNVGRQSIA